MYISISYFAGILVALVWFLSGWVWCYELSMFTCVISNLIDLQIGCSGSIVETLFSYGTGIRRIPVLSCRWSFGLCPAWADNRQSRLHGFISQKIELFATTAVRISNPTYFKQFVVLFSTCSLIRFIKPASAKDFLSKHRNRLLLKIRCRVLHLL
jgi:hypothetical protein